jgi:tetratricopeptide (TPR) repeat protein
MAQLYLTNNSFEDARNEAVTALRLNPKSVRAALFLGRALVGTKEYEKAISLLADMKKQIPGNTEILGNLAVASLRTKDTKKGEQYLNELLQIDPGNIQAIALLIGLKYKDNHAGAETFIQQQIKKAPDDPRLYYLLGGLLETQKKEDEALKAYNKAQELAPENVDALLASAKLLGKMGRNKEAMERFSKMVEKDPKSIPGNMGIAAIYESEGEHVKAMEQYTKVLAIKEDFAPAANNAAWLIASQPGGDLGKALMLAMKAKQALPDAPNVADTLGWVHYNRGSFPLAISQFEFALQKRPDDPTFTYHLALAQNGAAQKEAAVQTLTTLLNRKIDFAERKNAEELLRELTKK